MDSRGAGSLHEKTLDGLCAERIPRDVGSLGMFLRWRGSGLRRFCQGPSASGMSAEIQSVAEAGERVADVGRNNFVRIGGQVVSPGAAPGILILIHLMRLLRDAGAIHEGLDAFVNPLRGVRDAVLGASRGGE